VRSFTVCGFAKYYLSVQIVDKVGGVCGRFCGGGK
jgi:hypothetical protein